MATETKKMTLTFFFLAVEFFCTYAVLVFVTSLNSTKSVYKWHERVYSHEL